MEKYLNRQFIMDHKNQIIKAAAIILLISVAFLMYLVRANVGDKDADMIMLDGQAMTTEIGVNAEQSADFGIDIPKEDKIIFIDVGGAVVSPSVVELSEGDRVYQAIELAGGLTENADTTNVNLAEVLADGDKILIPKIGETSNYDTPSGIVTKNITSENNAQSALVNLNTATSSQLETLNGVGPSTAAKIISYRDKYGGFKKIEELMEVSGIGEKTFEKLKDSITV